MIGDNIQDRLQHTHRTAGTDSSQQSDILGQMRDALNEHTDISDRQTNTLNEHTVLLKQQMNAVVRLRDIMYV